jgi:hypothetical protein
MLIRTLWIKSPPGRRVGVGTCAVDGQPDVGGRVLARVSWLGGHTPQVDGHYRLEIVSLVPIDCILIFRHAESDGGGTELAVFERTKAPPMGSARPHRAPGGHASYGTGVISPSRASEGKPKAS